MISHRNHMEESSPDIDFDAEEENAEEALTQWEGEGATSRRCLRCGGNFLFHVTPSAYRIKCETEGCFVLTCRGI